MTTIDKLDMSVYNMYAVRARMMEQINNQWRLDQASTIPPQTHVLDILPKLTELDILLGVVPYSTPWAYFQAPDSFRNIRRSPFTFSRIAPTLGEEAKLEEKLYQVPCKTKHEEKEKQVLFDCFNEVSKINSWMGHIIGRIGQFLQA